MYGEINLPQQPTRTQLKLHKNHIQLPMKISANWGKCEISKQRGVLIILWTQ